MKRLLFFLFNYIDLSGARSKIVLEKSGKMKVVDGFTPEQYSLTSNELRPDHVYLS